MPRSLRTPWGVISPSVDVFPLTFLLVSYGIIYVLPGRLFFLIFHGDDGPIEWAQVGALFVAVLGSCLSSWRCRSAGAGAQGLGWLMLAIVCLLLLGEEISWGERLFGIASPSLQSLNVQGEVNLHNLKGLNSLMHASYVVFGLGLGYFGWRFLPSWACLPVRGLSLYFLPLALFAAYLDLSWLTNLERIRNDQEVFEFLAFLGLAVNGCRGAFPGWWASRESAWRQPRRGG